MAIIRPAVIEDLETITAIYNDAIMKTVATFDTQLKTLDEQRLWFADHGSKYPLLVAESDGTVVGWAALSRWSDRCAYADTAEISVYVKELFRGKGFGRKLLDCILDTGRKSGLHTAIARITEGNDVSVHLHKAFGFESIGVMREVGRKFGKLLDVQLMQIVFEDRNQFISQRG